MFMSAFCSNQAQFGSRYERRKKMLDCRQSYEGTGLRIKRALDMPIVCSVQFVSVWERSAGTRACASID